MDKELISKFITISKGGKWAVSSNNFLLDLALILLSTKLFGLLTKRIHMPQVVGALIAGVVLGPAMLGIISETEFIHQLAELGVIVLMFTAGLETDVTELKYTGKTSFIIAVFGVLIPLIGGIGVAFMFNNGDISTVLLQNIFIGVILTATSVSITVETLKELGKISTKAGSAILGAALIDDILGIIGLTIVTSLAGSSVSIPVVLLKIVAFFVIAGIVGIFTHSLFTKWVNNYTKDLRRFVIISFVMCLLLSYIAEHFFGVANITGAFIAGVIITNTSHTHYIASRFETLSYIFLSPIFFASIGLKLVLPEMTLSIIMFTLILTVVAVITKIIGCYFASLACKYTKKEAIQIGAGMVSRGEVALIMAMQGAPLGLLIPEFLAPVVIMVIITTIVSPILLKFAFADKKSSNT